MPTLKGPGGQKIEVSEESAEYWRSLGFNDSGGEGGTGGGNEKAAREARNEPVEQPPAKPQPQQPDGG